MEEEMTRLKTNKENFISRRIGVVLCAAVLMTLGFSAITIAATAAKQKSFPSAEAAVKAAVAAAKANDDKELLAIFGAQAKDLLSSGDAVADKQRRAQFLAAYDEKNRLATEGENTILIVGKNEWPFPIPVVKSGEAWTFDTAKGREEILNRRIGQNELNAIKVTLAYMDAQREYAMKDRDGDGILEYARRFRSESGKKNGLYWEAKSGEEQSPLGSFFAQAQKAGYAPQGSGGGQTAAPYHGYYYKILEAQGKNASGGAFNYVVKDNMIGGFALVAYPAEHGNSGVMTFIINHDGKVFQKDLGKNTAAVASAMKEYNPDSTWSEVKE
jgi:cell division protein FtsB